MNWQKLPAANPWLRGWVLAAAAWIALGATPVRAAETRQFTPLVGLPPPKIAAAAESYGDGYPVENLLRPDTADGNQPEYASRGLGVRTFVDFDFGRPVSLAGFEHVQRRTQDTVAEAALLFADTPDFKDVLRTVKVAHVDASGATTVVAFPPVTARHVRWQVTAAKPGRNGNLGGRSIRFFSAGTPEAEPRRIGMDSEVRSVVERGPGGPVQPLVISLSSPYAEPVTARVRVDGQEPRAVEIGFGTRKLGYSVPASETTRTVSVEIEVDGRKVLGRAIVVKPARKLTVYILPHSHTDIGYTAIQTDIEEKQVNNLLQGIADARRTASYPEGARFVWNVEVLWAADLFLKRLTTGQRAEFFRAVKDGRVALNGMYLNELTGLCRPEELIRLFRQATDLGERTGVPVDSAMISDVPGCTWGTVTAMAQAGIRYFSVAPNYFDRIGTILVEWENKPFWWVGPDGRSRVLVWIPFWGYAMSHRYRVMSPALVDDFCAGLEKKGYPYDIAYVRWAGHGDNAVPDPSICDFVRDWNASHVWPRFVISSTGEAFRAFEKRYGAALPRVRGDWTPYWEDGAGSSAAETAMNRASSERLAQAETLWAMLDPKRYPAGRFADAWKNVLLYSEHTWGAHCSISEPSIPFTTDQWNIKQSYATTANRESRQLLGEATQGISGSRRAAPVPCVDVYNTTSWTRSELALIPQEVSEGGNFVTDEQGRPIPAQRLRNGALAVMVRDLAPFSGRRFRLGKEGATVVGDAPKVDGTVIENGRVRVRVDGQTGGIVELRATGIDVNLADTREGHALNDYLYLVGNDLAALRRNGPVKITVPDRGPLVATLRIESDAPGCHRLVREIRLAAGSDHVELLDTVDKRRLAATNYFANEGKESVNFAFPFNVPDGDIRLDVPFGVIRPDTDQMPSACKNWFSVGCWADVANEDYGVTWVTLDAPLVQVGGITATLLNSQTHPEAWRRHVGRTQKLYVWAMNNHWGTNYRAHQDGATQFRFVLRPHRGKSSDAANARFATGFSQPLVTLPGRGAPPVGGPLVRVEPADVLVTALKPSDDGKAWILRLLGAGGTPVDATLVWAAPGPRGLWWSDTGEKRLRKIPGTIPVPAWGVVTVRAELPR